MCVPYCISEADERAVDAELDAMLIFRIEAWQLSEHRQLSQQSHSYCHPNFSAATFLRCAGRRILGRIGRHGKVAITPPWALGRRRASAQEFCRPRARRTRRWWPWFRSRLGWYWAADWCARCRGRLTFSIHPFQPAKCLPPSARTEFYWRVTKLNYHCYSDWIYWLLWIFRASPLCTSRIRRLVGASFWVDLYSAILCFSASVAIVHRNLCCSTRPFLSCSL